jgi:hypothetical protein
LQLLNSYTANAINVALARQARELTRARAR